MIIKHESDEHKMFDYEVKRGTFGVVHFAQLFRACDHALSFLNHITLRWMIRIFLETHARTSLDFAVPGVLGLDLFGLDMLGRVSAPKT